MEWAPLGVICGIFIAFAPILMMAVWLAGSDT
jgi:hypothetical protein